jgi:hypothetical protein
MIVHIPYKQGDDKKFSQRVANGARYSSNNA